MEIRDFFNEQSDIAIALSGGVDSSVLLFFAKKYAKRVKAYYAESQFQPKFERADAVKIAESLGVEYEIIPLDVLADKIVVSNPPDRCYYCKKNIFTAITEAAQRDGFSVVADGTNASDDVEERAGVISPLRECGYTKEKIRTVAKENGIAVFDKPSYACLATRIPCGTAITGELLAKTEKAESGLTELGFKNFRVRYSEDGAKLEFGKEDLKLYEKIKPEANAVILSCYDSIYPEIKERADE